MCTVYSSDDTIATLRVSTSCDYDFLWKAAPQHSTWWQVAPPVGANKQCTEGGLLNQIRSFVRRSVSVFDAYSSAATRRDTNRPVAYRPRMKGKPTEKSASFRKPVCELALSALTAAHAPRSLCCRHRNAEWKWLNPNNISNIRCRSKSRKARVAQFRWWAWAVGEGPLSGSTARLRPETAWAKGCGQRYTRFRLANERSRIKREWTAGRQGRYPMLVLLVACLVFWWPPPTSCDLLLRLPPTLLCHCLKLGPLLRRWLTGSPRVVLYCWAFSRILCPLNGVGTACAREVIATLGGARNTGGRDRGANWWLGKTGKKRQFRQVEPGQAEPSRVSTVSHLSTAGVGLFPLYRLKGRQRRPNIRSAIPNCASLSSSHKTFIAFWVSPQGNLLKPHREEEEVEDDEIDAGNAEALHTILLNSLLQEPLAAAKLEQSRESSC